VDKKFTGIIPPVITSFDKNGNFDEKAQRGLIRFLAEHVDGFYPCGTYGSGPLMTTDERKRVAEVVIEEKGKRFVIVHVGSATTRESVELAKHAQSAGAEGVGAIPPFYFDYTQEQLIDHYKALIDAVDIPVFLYNNPGLSGNPIVPETLMTLADYGLAGVKDSAFDLVNFYNYLLAVKKPNFAFIVGTEAIAASALDAGACGVIAGLANCFPEFMAEFYQIWKQGDPKKSAEMQLKVMQARSILKLGQTLAMTYAVLRMRGLNPGYPRRPFTEISSEFYDRIEKEYKQLGLL